MKTGMCMLSFLATVRAHFETVNRAVVHFENFTEGFLKKISLCQTKFVLL